MKKVLFVCFISVSILLLVTSCDLLGNLFGGGGGSANALQVKFYNDPSSSYVIRSIEIKEGGDDREAITPATGWSENLIPAGEVLNPGQHFYFDVDMPTYYFCYYRVTVDDSADSVSGNGLGEVTLEYALDDTDYPLQILYWGDTKRTVGVDLAFNESFWGELYNGVYVATAWNNAGWEERETTEVLW